jgi:CheY-like chemotaxis protein
VKTKLLLVDDTPANLLALESVLEPLGGLELVRANSGPEALRLLGEPDDFAVVLLDVMMPVMDGFEVARRIREQPTENGNRYVPIIFMTAANLDQQLLLRGYQMDAVDFIFKPFVPEILRSKVRALVAVHRLALEKQRAEEQLRKSQEELARRVQERLTMAADASGLGLWRIDGTGSPEDIFWCTDQCRLHMCLPLGKELRLEQFYRTIHEDERPQFIKAIQHCYYTGCRIDVEVRASCTSDSTDGERWVRVLGRAVYNDEGNPSSFDGVTFDLTDRKRAEIELRTAHDAALEASRAKSTFLANMSHELRTPLNAIIGYSEMLLEESRHGAGVHQLDDISKIAESGRHLLALINEILDLSKIEAGKMDLYVRTFDVCTAIEQASNAARPIIERNGNTLTIHCDQSAVGSMIADETKVRQILINLLSNAGKFTKDGEIRLECERYRPEQTDPVAEEPEWLQIRISDTGIGMNSGEMARLFRDFTQVDPSSTRQYGGTGLGLAISRRFARMMGGDISVRSSKGEGTTFTVLLPVRVHGMMHPTGSEHTPIPLIGTSEMDTQVLPAPEDSGKTVLVIDDDATVHELMRRNLEPAGFRLMSAFDGRYGLDLAKQFHPRAITLDISMPGMDGWSVLTELKANPATANIPVIMTSVIEDRALAFALGASDYLIKPLDRHRLIEILRRQRPSLHGKTVLIVEDDPTTRELAGRTVGTLGCKVEYAENGDVALDKLTKLTDTPVLIILDLMMPGLDGFTFLEHIRKNENWRNLPVVVTTAKELTPEDRRRLNGQAELILRKGDYTREDLVREVSKALS